jgi:steroid delta-isomerase
MPNPDAIKATVERYVTGIGAGDVDAVVDLFAEHATVEDPVGTPVHNGRDAIRAFYAGSITMAPMSTELLTVRVAGDTAAFLFRVTSDFGETKIEIDPLDVMTFDDDAKVTSMRAIWSPDDMRTL